MSRILDELTSPKLIAVLGVVGALASIATLSPEAAVVIGLIAALLWGLRVYRSRESTPGPSTAGVSFRQASRLSDSHGVYLFVYGSLLSPDSLYRTLKAKLPAGEIQCIPVRVLDHELRWVPTTRSRLRGPDARRLPPRTWHSVTVSPREGGECRGAIIALTRKTLHAVRDREIHYEMVRLPSDKVRALGEDVELPPIVHTFSARSDAAGGEDAPEAAVRKGYVEHIQAGYRALGWPSKEPREIAAGAFGEVVEAYFPQELLEQRLGTAEGKQGLEKAQRRIAEILVRDSRLGGGGTGRARGPERRNVGLAPLLLEGWEYDRLLECAESALRGSVEITRLLSGKPEILIGAGYKHADLEILGAKVEQDALMPTISRVDLLHTKAGFKVLEVNSDSPAGMRQIDVLAEQQQLLLADLGVTWAPGESPGVVDKLVAGLAEGVGSCALVEYREGEFPLTEMRHIAARLQEQGVRSDLVLIEERPEGWSFDHDRGVVLAAGGAWDRIYKRVVYSHLDRRDDAAGALRALREASTALPGSVVNSMAARIVGSKIVLAGLSNPQMRVLAGLQDRESALAECIPFTAVWGACPFREQFGVDSDESAMKAEVMGALHEYVWKPIHGLGGAGIIIGPQARTPDLTSMDEVWWTGGTEAGSRQYVVQEYIPHSNSRIPVMERDPLEHDVVHTDWRHTLFGVYLLNGEPVAAEAKLGRELPVNVSGDAARTAVFRASAD